MALTSTVRKLQVQVSDLDRQHYGDYRLTLAQHPSETDERLLVRILAYCLNAAPGLEMCKGLSTTEEAALWEKSDDGRILHWIELGQPEATRLKRARGQASRVSFYAYGKSRETWWQQHRTTLMGLDVEALGFDWPQVQAASALVAANMDLTLTVTEGLLYLADAKDSHTLQLLHLD